VTLSKYLPLSDCAMRLERNYETMRQHASKHKDTFPKPVIVSIKGKGLAWDVDDIEEWYRQYDNQQSKKGTGQVNPSKRASLGHKFRKVRMKNQCSECPEPFYDQEVIVEKREGDELYLMHEECYDRYTDRKNGIPPAGTGDS